MNICLIRHGETDWNKARRLQGRTDIPLSETGAGQAEELADVLAGEPWDMVIHSPLQRAAQTARIIAERLQLSPVVADTRFVEREYGKAEGLTAEERNCRYPSRDYPGMEDWDMLRERMMDGLYACAAQYGDKNLIIVSHGAAINAVLTTLSGGAVGSGKTRLHAASATLLHYDSEAFTMVYYNRRAAELQKQ